MVRASHMPASPVPRGANIAVVLSFTPATLTQRSVNSDLPFGPGDWDGVFSWLDEQMGRRGCLAEAARQLGCVRNTLVARYDMKRAGVVKTAPPPRLGQDVEDKVVAWIKLAHATGASIPSTFLHQSQGDCPQARDGPLDGGRREVAEAVLRAPRRPTRAPGADDWARAPRLSHLPSYQALL